MSTPTETIAKVTKNLENTIKGKELLLAELQVQQALATSPEVIGIKLGIEYLKVNLDELRAILADLTS